MNAAETRVVSFTPSLYPHPPIYCYRVVEDKRRKKHTHQHTKEHLCNQTKDTYQESHILLTPNSKKRKNKEKSTNMRNQYIWAILRKCYEITYVQGFLISFSLKLFCGSQRFTDCAKDYFEELIKDV